MLQARQLIYLQRSFKLIDIIIVKFLPLCRIFVSCAGASVELFAVCDLVTVLSPWNGLIVFLFGKDEHAEKYLK